MGLACSPGCQGVGRRRGRRTSISREGLVVVVSRCGVVEGVACGPRGVLGVGLGGRATQVSSEEAWASRLPTSAPSTATQETLSMPRTNT